MLNFSFKDIFLSGVAFGFRFVQRVEQAGTRLAEPEPPRTGDCLAIPQFTFQASPAWGKQPGQTSRDGRTFAGLERARRTFLSLGNKVSFFRPRDSQKSQTPSHACPPPPPPPVFFFLLESGRVAGLRIGCFSQSRSLLIGCGSPVGVAKVRSGAKNGEFPL